MNLNPFENIKYGEFPDVYEYGYVYNGGAYTVFCLTCNCYFEGDKRAWRCYDCAKERLDGRGDLIDTWVVKIGSTSYTDDNLSKVLSHVKVLDDNETITITKKKMGINEYEKLPEFNGF